jgi:hypothetical protein
MHRLPLFPNTGETWGRPRGHTNYYGVGYAIFGADS